MLSNILRFDAVKNGEDTTIALWESEDGEYVRYSVLANYAHSLKVCIGQKIKLRDERDALAARVAELEGVRDELRAELQTVTTLVTFSDEPWFSKIKYFLDDINSTLERTSVDKGA